jgi:hypothetical protein
MAQCAGVELALCGRTPLERLVVDGEVVPGPVLTNPAVVPWRADVVLLAVKAHQTAARRASWARCAVPRRSWSCSRTASSSGRS